MGVEDRLDSARQMGYDRRRLAREELIQRVEGKLCYVLTPSGRRLTLFLTKLHARALRPGRQALDARIAPNSPPLPRVAANDLDAATTVMLREAKLVA